MKFIGKNNDKKGYRSSLWLFDYKVTNPGLAVSQAARANLLSLATELPVKFIALKSNASSFAFIDLLDLRSSPTVLPSLLSHPVETGRAHQKHILSPFSPRW